MSSQKASPRSGLKGMAKAHAVEILNLPNQPDDGYHGLPDTPIKWLLKNNHFFIDMGFCDGTHPDCTHSNVCECMIEDCNCQPDGARCDTKIWRLSPRAREIMEWLEKPNTLPCGHQGLHNIRGGGYTCQNEGCDAEFSREIAKQLY